MANRVQHRHSNVPGAVPTALLPNEIAVNTADNKLFLGNPAGVPTDLSKARLGDVLKVSRQTYGIRDTGAALVAIANSATPDAATAGVLGYTPGLSAASYPDIDSVAAYAYNNGREPFFIVVNPTFSVVNGGAARLFMPVGTPLTPAQMARLAVNLQILTNHTPWRYTGWIKSWDPAGTWVEMIEGFFRLGDVSNALNQNPTGIAVAGGGALQVAFAPLTKVWAHNANVYLNAPTTFGARIAAGFELGVINATGAAHNAADGGYSDRFYSWGYDVFTFGSRCGSGYIARGNWDVAFHATSGLTASFLVDGAYVTGGTSRGFVSTQAGGTAFACRPVGAAVDAFAVRPGGTMEIGNGAAQFTFLDMHSSGFTANDYDVRLVAGGGTSTNGRGDFTVRSATVTLDAAVLDMGIPSVAGTVSIDLHSSGYLNDHDVRLSANAGVNGTSGQGTLTVAAASLVMLGNIELGAAAAGVTFVDFHSSGFPNDNDVRLSVSGGVNGTPGQGAAVLAAASFNVSGGTIAAGSFTFAQLVTRAGVTPAPSVGSEAWGSNVRKTSEGAGAGTGCKVYWDSGASWRRTSDDQPITV